MKVTILNIIEVLKLWGQIILWLVSGWAIHWKNAIQSDGLYREILKITHTVKSANSLC
jgi:hypothetical protein